MHVHNKHKLNPNFLSQWGMWTDIWLSACLGGIPWQIYFARYGIKNFCRKCKYSYIQKSYACLIKRATPLQSAELELINPRCPAVLRRRPHLARRGHPRLSLRRGRPGRRLGADRVRARSSRLGVGARSASGAAAPHSQCKRFQHIQSHFGRDLM